MNNIFKFLIVIHKDKSCAGSSDTNTDVAVPRTKKKPSHASSSSSKTEPVEQAIGQQQQQQSGQSRDRFSDASNDIMLHLSDKVVNMIRKPAFQERIQSILDPIVNHVINRVFPYIVLSSILFLILILVTVSTFIIVMRSSLLAIQEGRGVAALAIDKTMMNTGFPVNW